MTAVSAGAPDVPAVLYRVEEAAMALRLSRSAVHEADPIWVGFAR